MADNITIDKLAVLYKKIRADRDDMVAHHKEVLGALKKDLDKVAIAAQEILQTQGVASMSTDGVGTFFMQESAKASLADATAFKEWVVANNQLGLLENRVATNNLKEYLTANDGILPPGVNMFTENKVHFRKA